MHFNGQGVPKDPVKARDLWRRAAAQGHARAQYNLGMLLVHGRGVPEDAVEGAMWTRKAAEDSGHPQAQYNLACMYANGQGVPKDFARAVEWCRKAAGQGVREAQRLLLEIHPPGGGDSANA